MKTSPSTFVLAATLLTAAVAVHAQEWPVRQFDVRNGLPQSSVVDLAMDSLGFLWISTEGGLVRYDGHRFKTVRPPQDNLGTVRMRELITTQAGELLLFNAQGRLFRAKGPSAFEELGAPVRRDVDGRPPHAAWLLQLADSSSAMQRSLGWKDMRILDLGDGLLGVISRNRLLWLRDSTILGEVTLPFLRRKAFVLDGLVVGLAPDGRWHAHNVRTGHTWELTLAAAAAMHPGEGFDLVFSDTYRSAYLHQGKRLYALALDRTAKQLTATDVGLTLPERTQLTVVVEAPGGRTLFVGTTERGLLVYHRPQVHVLTAPWHTVANNAYYALLELPDGAILAAGSSGLVRFDGTGKGQLLPGTEAVQWTGMALLPDSTVLVQARDRLHTFDPRTGALRPFCDTPTPTSAFLAEGEGILIGNRSFIGKVDSRGALHSTFHIGSEHERDRPLHMERDALGRLLVASCGALVRSTDPGCTRFDTLRVDAGLCFRTVSVQPEGTLVGTYGGGLFLLDAQDRLQPIRPDPLAALGHVHAVVRDDADNLWISTNQGLLRCAAGDLFASARDPQHSVHFTYHRELAGLEVPEFNGGAMPVYLRLRDGRFAFSSMGGVVLIDPSDMAGPGPSTAPVLEAVRVDGEPWTASGPLELERHHQELRFEVALPVWDDPLNGQVEYRIPGLLEAWQPIDLRDGQVVISRPPAGDHAILLRVAGGTPRSVLLFTVPPSFWRTPGGMLLLALGASALVLLGLRVQHWRGMQRERALRGLVEARTAELALRNKALQEAVETREGLIALLSHDIVTPLRFIARAARGAGRQLEGERYVDLRNTLRELSDSSEKLRGNASALLDWAKRGTSGATPEHVQVPVRAAAEEALQLWAGPAHERGITLENAVADEAMLHTDREALRVMLNNTVGNAIGHAQGATRVVVSFTADDAGAVIRVEDDGTGVDAATLAGMRALLDRPLGHHRSGRAGTDGQGIGLMIIANMAHLAGARISVDSGAGGTSVGIRFPDQGIQAVPYPSRMEHPI